MSHPQVQNGAGCPAAAPLAREGSTVTGETTLAPGRALGLPHLRQETLPQTQELQQETRQEQ